MKFSAVICTHNPRRDYLEATLVSIRQQAGLACGVSWELLLIDNRSSPPLQGQLTCLGIRRRE